MKNEINGIFHKGRMFLPLAVLTLALIASCSGDGGGGGIVGPPKIYVTDRDNSRIVRMDDMTGAGSVSIGSYGSGTYQFINPQGIFVDTAEKIYVADSRIVRIDDMTGAGWTTFGTLGSGTNQFSGPSGIFVR